jgi:hypothetical protein
VAVQEQVLRSVAALPSRAQHTDTTTFRCRAVCYKYTKQWKEMAGDAQQSCTLEPTVPENFLRRAVALKQLKDRDEELQAVCTQAEALDMPDKLRDQLQMLMR